MSQPSCEEIYHPPAYYERPAFEPLRRRGITPDWLACTLMDVVTRNGLPCYRYPVFDADGRIAAWRLKRVDSQHPYKYRWEGEGRADLLYGAHDLLAGRPAFLCAGEADTWLMGSLELCACCFLAGEGAVPPGTVAQLVQAAPSCVVVVYDNDDAGHGGAVKAVQALRAAGLQAMALTMPAHLPIKGDVTDLYAACGHNRDAFLQRLRSLEHLPMPDPAPHPPIRRRPALPADGALSRIERFKAEHPIDEVIGDAVPLKTHQSGRYLTGRCPFHDDRTPSFVVWPEVGKFRCYGCGEHGDVVDFLKLYQAGRAA